MKINHIFLIVCVILSSCKKDDEVTEPVIDERQLEKDILIDFAMHVANPVYASINTNADSLRSAISTFTNNLNIATLDNARQAWRNVRQPWEQCEAFIFGP